MCCSRKYHDHSQLEHIKTDKFRNKYIDLFEESQINAKSLAWCAKHAELYINASDLRHATHLILTNI